MPSRCEICCEIMIAVLLPPLGVCLRHGCCTVCLCYSLSITSMGIYPFTSFFLFHIQNPIFHDFLVIQLSVSNLWWYSNYLILWLQSLWVTGQIHDFNEIILICAGWIHYLLAPYNTRISSWYNLCSLCHYLYWSWSVLWWI